MTAPERITVIPQEVEQRAGFAIVHFPPVAGWSQEESWWCIDKGHPVWPKGQKYFRKKGDEVPSLEEVGVEAFYQWLKDHEAQYYDPLTRRPVKQGEYKSILEGKDSRVLEVIEALKREIEEGEFTSPLRELALKQGFHLGMTNSEMEALGNRYYGGFSVSQMRDRLSKVRVKKEVKLYCTRTFEKGKRKGKTVKAFYPFQVEVVYDLISQDFSWAIQHR
jgi:hypothetical protein